MTSDQIIGLRSIALANMALTITTLVLGTLAGLVAGDGSCLGRVDVGVNYINKDIVEPTPGGELTVVCVCVWSLCMIVQTIAQLCAVE